jgi:hypothetical protein
METELNGVRAFGLKSNLGISEKHVVGFVCSNIGPTMDKYTLSCLSL